MLKLIKIKKTVCPQCTLLDIMLQASGIEPDITINHDELEESYEDYGRPFVDQMVEGIMGVPVLIFYKDGKIVDRIDSTRGLTPDMILEKMKQHGA